MNSYEFERLMVTGIISKGNCGLTREIVWSIKPEMIENAYLRAVYKIASSLIHQGEPLDGESVYQSLEGDYQGNFVSLFRNANAINLEIWANRVRQCHMIRNGIESLKKALTIMENVTPQTLNAASGEISALLAGVRVESGERVPVKISELIEPYMGVIENRLSGEESALYLKTGIQPIDEEYGGFDRTDLIVIAARPGMGKTELTIAISNAIGAARGKGLFVSLEMSENQIVERHIADRGDLSVSLLRNPKNMYQEDYTKLTAAIGTLMEEDNYMIAGSFTVDQIIHHAQKLNEDGDLSFLAIDYLQLITMEKMERKDLAVGEVTRKLKLFALESKVPVILLSQLNRNVENRLDKRPLMADLRESGAIEQDADVIIFCYRDEVYNPESPLTGVAELIIGKYRSGKPTKVYQRFVNGHFRHIDQIDGAQKFALCNPQMPKQGKLQEKWA